MLLARSWEGYGLVSLRGERGGRRRRRRLQQQQQQVHHSAHEAPATAGGSGHPGGERGGTGGDGNGAGNAATDSLDHAARCLEESLRVYPTGSDRSLAVTSVLAAVSMEQGQLDRAWALLETVLEQRLPELEEGADG